MLNWVKRKVRSLRVRLARQHYSKMDVQDVFHQVYANGKWGDSAGRFTSGSGSDSENVGEYVDFVREYVQENGVARIVDLGCGDFRVGKAMLDGLQVNYVGIDVVEPLIEWLNTNFSNEQIKFVCQDIIEEELPEGDLYLVRQVFQHLSNDQIGKVLKKLSGKTAIVTEHLPKNPSKYNVDKPAGPDIRLYEGSGVFLECAPFSLNLRHVLEKERPFNGRPAVLRSSVVKPHEGK